jgi:hypothetical protein
MREKERIVHKTRTICYECLCVLSHEDNDQGRSRPDGLRRESTECMIFFLLVEEIGYPERATGDRQ